MESMLRLSERMQTGRPAPRKRLLFVDDEAGIRATLPPILRNGKQPPSASQPGPVLILEQHVGHSLLAGHA